MDESTSLFSVLRGLTAIYRDILTDRACKISALVDCILQERAELIVRESL